MGGRDVWFFDRVARWYDHLMPAIDERSIEAGFDRASRAIETVVDVGGGTGRAIRSVAVRRRLVCDASIGMLRRVPTGLSPVRGTATALPFGPATVDAVVIVDALHHFPDPSVVIDEAARILRPGGILYIQEFDRQTVRGRLLELGERVLGFDPTLFTINELADLLEGSFEVTVLDRGFACTVVGTKPRHP